VDPAARATDGNPIPTSAEISRLAAVASTVLDQIVRRKRPAVLILGFALPPVAEHATAETLSASPGRRHQHLP